MRPPGNPAGKRISIALAVGVHLLLAAFLFYGVSWQTKSPDAVEVELVRATPEPPAPPVAVPPAPTPEPPPPAPEPKPTPPPPKPEIAIKEKEKPKPPPPKPVPAAAPRVDPFQEQLKREAEQLTQRKQVESAAQELAQVKASQAAAARNKGLASYLGKIRDKIRGNIALPPDIKGNPEAVFEVTQLPSGEVINVRLKKSSGNAALDSAVERAILKSSPLPKPEQSDVFDRLLNIPYRPRED
ncbi:MAG: TonB C-terminal domain-containing protein [Sulfuritalea sp.]|nr:TonB C-terminal domain-containing protein [Sulfuritalea sp.]MBK9351044.1 TonB C-terminal domain-containing protein [Sulfuritalea sp.]